MITIGAPLTRYVYDGAEVAAEVDSAGAIQHRYVRGDGPDELLVVYSNGAASSHRWYSTDERGSVLAQSDATGVLQAINRYDEYGNPQSTNTGTFGYTGQMWLSAIGAYNYKARIYSPALGGRFLQTDPIGYAAGPNWYAYVHNDPVNFIDPLGLCGGVSTGGPGDPIVIIGCRLADASLGGNGGFVGSGPSRLQNRLEDKFSDKEAPIVVIGQRRKSSAPTDTSPPQIRPPVIPSMLVLAAATNEKKLDRCTLAPDDPLGVDISAACRAHDDCYAARRNKFQCDFKLFNDIFNECRMKLGLNSAQVCGTLATTYLLAVSTVGIEFYFATPKAD